MQKYPVSFSPPSDVRLSNIAVLCYFTIAPHQHMRNMMFTIIEDLSSGTSVSRSFLRPAQSLSLPTIASGNANFSVFVHFLATKYLRNIHNLQLCAAKIECAGH
jgi:hypothetical protein